MVGLMSAPSLSLSEFLRTASTNRPSMIRRAICSELRLMYSENRL